MAFTAGMFKEQYPDPHCVLQGQRDLVIAYKAAIHIDMVLKHELLIVITSPGHQNPRWRNIPKSIKKCN